MDSAKSDFPGLLARGFHVYTLDQIRDVCVAPFALSTTRQTIWENLVALVGRFERVGLHCDFWLDGSYVTKKLNPNDLDIVARLPEHVYNEPLNSDVVRELEWFDSDAPCDLSLDTYHFPDSAPGSPLHDVTRERFSYWEDLFSTGRDGTTEKGIIVLRVNGGVA